MEGTVLYLACGGDFFKHLSKFGELDIKSPEFGEGKLNFNFKMEKKTQPQFCKKENILAKSYTEF